MQNIRLQKLREEINKNGLDGALIYSDTNRNYLTKFTGNESYIIITNKDAFFITDFRYIEQAKSEVIDFDILQYDMNIYEYLANVINSLGIKRLGFEDNYMSFSMYESLKGLLNHCSLVALNGIVERLRQVKDENEILHIQKAAAIADEAFLHILDYLKPGITENSVSLELEFFMRSKGASNVSFPIIAASGQRSSLPHGIASNKVIEPGDFLTMDFGCIYNGYCSDMTRTVVIGKAGEKQKHIYNIVLEANEKALNFIKPGIKGEEIDRIARDVIANAGYGSYFGHGLGHGVGMEIHELPYVSKKGKEPIQAGMVITDEPGIYISNFGGVRIEELVLVTEEGCRVLSKSTKQLIEIV